RVLVGRAWVVDSQARLSWCPLRHGAGLPAARGAHAFCCRLPVRGRGDRDANPDPASSVCHFVVWVSGLLALYCLLLLLYWIYSSYIEESHRSSVGLCVALGISATATFLILVSACILRFGTSSLCSSITALNRTNSCSEAQKMSWTPPGTALQFYANLQTAETSSWVNLVLWCLILMLQVIQFKSKATLYISSHTRYWPQERADSKDVSETDALVG
uniref:Transmembrane protein 179B n=1 Tax=Nannospalax galili TaxID=1026970 RepID=A0A8C6RMZ7_NANGA